MRLQATRLRDLLAVVAVVGAPVACGGRVGTAPEVGVPAEGGTDDASVLDDSSAPIDATTTFDAPASDDAPVSDDTGPAAEASDDASTVDALEEATSPSDSGAGVETGPEASVDAGSHCIDLCVLGEGQCDYQAVGCTDGGGATTCLQSHLAACVQGSTGCTEWGPETACSAGVACCSCHNVPCFDGGVPACISCPSGPLGTPCTQDTDCGTDACDGVTHVCVGNQCNDNRQDGWETDVDCGGGACGGCSVGRQCAVNFDCQSGHFCAMPAHICQ